MLGVSEWHGNETRPKLCWEIGCPGNETRSKLCWEYQGVLGMSLGPKCSIIHDPSCVGNIRVASWQILLRLSVNTQERIMT